MGGFVAVDGGLQSAGVGAWNCGEFVVKIVDGSCVGVKVANRLVVRASHIVYSLFGVVAELCRMG